MKIKVISSIYHDKGYTVDYIPEDKITASVEGDTIILDIRQDLNKINNQIEEGEKAKHET